MGAFVLDNYKDPEAGKIYLSPSLNNFSNPERKIRIASKTIESQDSYAFGTIKDEIVLRHTTGGKTTIKAKFFEDNRGIFVLSLQGYSTATDKPHNASFAFIGSEITELLDFINNIQTLYLEGSHPQKIVDKDLEHVTFTSAQVAKLFQSNQDSFIEIIRNEITTEDLVAIGYRKKQLAVFENLLSDDGYFDRIKTAKNCTNESLWQQFFEKNQWIFGYGLGYLFLSELDDKKLEQVVRGHSVNSRGKRVDALMKTRGIISNLCFVEIKTDKTPLLESSPYRTECWAPSKELAGAVSQIQGTVASSIETLYGKVSLTDTLGNPTKEEIYNFQPKSFLVIGNLQEFETENGFNADKLRSFELYRRNTINPEIITYDELLERARFIVLSNESSL